MLGRNGSKTQSPSAGPKVTVLDRHNFSSTSAAWQRGEAASRLPYGLEALGEHYELHHSDYDFPRPMRPFLNSLQYRTDREVSGVLSALPGLRASTACVSIFEDFGLTYQLLRRLVPGLPPHVLMTCWISQRALSFANKRNADYARLLARAEVVTVFSENQVPLLTQRLHVPEGRITPIDFGVATGYFTPVDESGPPYVAVVGQDAGRDWSTLFRAVALAPEIEFRIAIWPSDLPAGGLPPNAHVVGGLPVARYRRLVQESRCVALSTYPLPYPTGQSVMLESMACGRPVVMTDSVALRQYAHWGGTVTVPPGDPAALAQAVRRLMSDPSSRREIGQRGREAVTTRYDSRRMWNKVHELIEAHV